MRATGEEAKAAVLQHFTVLNDRSEIRLIDADGSVYEGQIQPVAIAVEGAANRASSAGSGGGMSFQSIGGAFGGRLDIPTPTNFSVVVSGTNLSLQQQVRFTGNLMLTEQQAEDGRNVFSNTLRETTARTLGPGTMTDQQQL